MIEIQFTPLVIMDIDGTLSDCRHRLHHINGVTRDWDAFYEKCGDDPPISPIVSLTRLLHGQGITIFYFTGRRESCRKTTEDWLHRHGLPYAYLFMRQDKDYRPDHELKLEMYRANVENQSRVLFVVEDRARVCQMWRENGIICLQCADGEY